MNRLLLVLIVCVLGLPRLSANAEEPHPITDQDYCRFLKCVATSDTHCFYDEKLSLDPACILREGTPGNYSYSVLPGKENQRVSYLSWHDAACYAYWKKQEEDHLSDDLTLSLSAFQLDDAATAQNSDQELKSNIVPFSFINDKALDDGSLPSKEPPSWISYMMVPILFLGESGQAVSKASLDHISVPGEEGLHLREESLNRMGMSNMKPAAADSITDHTISSAPSEETQAISTSPTGKLGATSLVQVTPSHLSYRFNNGTWERKTLEGTWEATDRFNVNKPSALSKVLTTFIQNYTRTDNINTKKEEYQKELKILSSDSHRALMLNDLVPILEKAISYQHALTGHLIDNARTLDDPKKVESKTFLNFIDAVMINDHPNKVEYIAKQIEEDYEHLAEYQNKLSEVEAQIDLQPIQLTGLLQSRGHLNKAVELQRTLIEQRALYAQLLDPPCEQLNTTTQANVDQYKWKLVETEALVSREYLLFQANTAQGLGLPDKALYLDYAASALLQAGREAQKPPELRNPEAINLLQRSADLCQEAANAWKPDQPKKAIYLGNAGFTLSQAAGEAQKPPELRNPEAINLFQRAVDLFQEAANAWKPDQPEKALYLDNAGHALLKAAGEAQKPPELRNLDVINWFQRAADLRQKGVNAWDQNQPKKAFYLNNAGNALFQAAEEAQKTAELRNPDVIDWFQRSATLRQEAANAWDQNQPKKAFYLNWAGYALFQAAGEAQKLPELRNPDVIDWFQRAVDLFQEAANAWKPDQPEKAVYLDNAGHALFQAAQEAQKPPELRNPAVIYRLKRSATLRQEAASAWNLSQPTKAIYLNNAGNALFQAAQEAQEPPELRNPDVINWFQRAANMCQEAANAWNPDQPNKASPLNNAGNALFKAAQEAQKPEPNPEVIARLITEAEELEEKANSSPSCIIS